MSHSLSLSPAPERGSSLLEEEDREKAVTELERKHLVETDRHIAECKEYIAKQRERIERAIQEGRSDHAGRIRRRSRGVWRGQVGDLASNQGSIGAPITECRLAD